jgi:hypothetical protein
VLYFDNDKFGLDDAAKVLREHKLTVVTRGETLDVRSGDGGPVLHVQLARGRAIREDANRLGAGTRHAERLARCGARLEITFTDLDKVLDEINTLIEVQGSLEKATGGICYNCWNNRFSED